MSVDKFKDSRFKDSRIQDSRIYLLDVGRQVQNSKIETGSKIQGSSAAAAGRRNQGARWVSHPDGG
jgi:hypothetical protein